MTAIRINELARELEVKSRAITDFLPTIGVHDKKSHSSALDESLAQKVREHFQAAGGETEGDETVEAEPEPSPAKTSAPDASAKPAAPSDTQAAAHSKAQAEAELARKLGELHAHVPMQRSIAEIQAQARKLVATPPPARHIPAPAPTAGAAQPMSPVRTVSPPP